MKWITAGKEWLAGLEPWLGILLVLVVVGILLGFLAGFFPWESWIANDKKDKDDPKKAQKGKRQLTAIIGLLSALLIISAAIFLWAWWDAIPALVTSAEQTGKAVPKGQGLENFKEWLIENLSKWHFDLSIALVVLWVISVRRAWTGSFYKDWRLIIGTEKNPPFPKNWLVIFSSVGFFPFAIASLWWPHWALFALTFVFWRIGPIFEITVPDTEKHVPKVFARSFWADGMKDWVWFGLESPNYHNPALAFFMLIVNLPAWLFFYSVTVLSRGRLDKKYPIQAQTKDGPILSLEIRVQGETCANVQVFMRLFPSERQESIETEGAGEIAKNLVTDFTKLHSMEVVQSEIDKMWKQPSSPGGEDSMAQIFANRVLKDKGHFIESSDFGMPLPSADMQKAQEAGLIAAKMAEAQKAKTDADAYTITGLAKAQAEGEAAKILAPAKALAEASGGTMTFSEARQSIVDEKKAEATRTIIEGNAVPLVNLPPQS